jgi:threonine dehydrogenase-like Zn-dependent dehydrogenase
MLYESQMLGNQVLCKTLYSAISPGTEIAAYKGEPPLRPGPIYPRVIGYCNIAKVLAVGNAVTRFEVGDLVLNFQSHRSAFICDEDKIACIVPENANLVNSSTTYLFHLGYNALLKGGFRPGYSVAVLGLGALGLTSIALASAFGAEVYGISNQGYREKLALEFGAKKIYQKTGLDCSQGLMAITNGGVDLLVSTSSSWSDWKVAISSVRKEGVICVLGFPGRAEPIPSFNPLDSQYFYDSQLKIICCGYSPDVDVPPHDIRFTIKRNCEFLLGQIKNNRLPASKIISAVIPWRDLNSLYERMALREQNLITGVLDWTIEN